MGFFLPITEYTLLFSFILFLITNPNHYKLLQIITNHYKSLQIITNHYKLLQIITNVMKSIKSISVTVLLGS
jgi:hypothetical protein